MALSQFVPFSATELLLASTVFCLVFWVLKGLRPRVPKCLRSPPEPWGWPLLGHVLTLGKNPHLVLTKMSQRYGDVLQIRIGSTPVVVLSGLDTIWQAVVRQGDDFKGQPDLYSFTLITDGQSISFSPDSGPMWAARRHLAQNTPNTFSIASDPASSSSCYLEEHVSKEAEALISRLQELTEGPGHFNPYNQIVVSVVKVIGAMCFGHFPESSDEMLSLVKNSYVFVENATSGNPMDFFPILCYLPNPALQSFKAFNQRFLRFLQETVQEHYQDFDKPYPELLPVSTVSCSPLPRDQVGGWGCPAPRDRPGKWSKVQPLTLEVPGVSLSLCLDKHSKKRSGTSSDLIPQEKTVNLANDIFGADTMIGKGQWPRLSDRPQLPYLEAFILETFRHSSFVPFTIPHRRGPPVVTTRDTTLNGFYIPKECCVFINQWQVNHDPQLWGDPSEFRPERFLTAKGTALNKPLSEKILLFGLGKRRCIGEVLGKWEVFLFLAILLQQLEFSVPPGVRVDLTPIYGLTMKHARCEHVQARLRFSFQ
ncbi:cytochrome P450 1 sub A member 2 [Saguinus oedipus]|uniref:Cytochrome P450 1A n=1 Tax=Saguinus oedipus TaxID=9490 RepID=A0ABQ9V321_SAGOE|nr:cytochrome P450 1 sub A member 2 [Saguinus oedipus]